MKFANFKVECCKQLVVAVLSQTTGHLIMKKLSQVRHDSEKNLKNLLDVPIRSHSCMRQVFSILHNLENNRFILHRYYRIQMWLCEKVAESDNLNDLFEKVKSESIYKECYAEISGD